MPRKTKRSATNENVVPRTSGMKALTMDELKSLLAALKSNRHGDRDYVMAVLAVRHAMRADEVCDFKWSDMDMDGGTITVRRLKGSRTRANLLAEDEKKAVLKVPHKGAHVFLGPQGKPFDRMTFARIIERAGVKAGLPFRCGPHRLKHTCGTYHANAGKLTPMQIQRLMGHKDFRSTQIYIDMAPVPLDKTFMPV